MDEDILNMSLRKFLKKVGVTSQREIEQAVRSADESGDLVNKTKLDAVVKLQIADIGLDVSIDGKIELS